MSEYIEREAALESVREKLLISESLPDTIAKSASVFTLASMNDSLKSIPAADVRPVVRGRWELDRDPGEPWRYVCNICGEKTKDTVMGKPRANFCPNCGADMRGGDGNG